MICIGLDLATHNTGCCILNDGDLVHYECITSDESDDSNLRIRSIGEKIIYILELFKPEIMFIEDAPIMKNSSASMLCVLQGYMLRIADEKKIPVDIFQPASWRKTIGIKLYDNGKMVKKDKLKQDVVDYVNDRFGLSLIYVRNEKKNGTKSQDDIADSIGIACCGIARKQNG